MAYMFQGFKPSGMQKIAKKMGYSGPMDQFQSYVDSDPMRKQQMQQYNNYAVQMAKGGAVKKYQDGGLEDGQMPEEGQQETSGMIGDETVDRYYDPRLPEGGETKVDPIKEDSSQIIREGTGGIDPRKDVEVTTAGDAQQAQQPETMAPSLIEADTKSQEAQATLEALNAAELNPNNPNYKINAAQMTKSSVSDLDAAQGSAYLIDNPPVRELQRGEIIEPTFNAEKAATFSEQIQAATATPSDKATIQGQLEGLMQQFEGGQTPPWAAGAMRGAMGALASRGLGASSLAGQAVIQAAMESALPIAQADANTFAQFESQNLSNRQQRAMLAAQQRAAFIGQEFDQAFQARVMNASKISDIANMNFTAEQQVHLENSRAVNSMNIANLNNRQALVMAEAAALAQLDMANLNNRQQAAVMNAQNFLQVDMQNLSNRQQTNLFKTQQALQALFNDQAAENATRQFNAASENQTNQFFAKLATQVSQFNTAQFNAQNQFNAGQTNAMAQFQAQLDAQVDQFNAQNELVIAQNNAQWRRELATVNTAALNRSYELNAKATLDISNQAYANLWNYFADTMEWAWKSGENESDRITNIALAEINAAASLESAQITANARLAESKASRKSALFSSLGSFAATLGAAYVKKM